MIEQVASETLSANGGSKTTQWYKMPDNYMAHSMFSVITGSGTVTCDIELAAMTTAGVITYQTLYSNLSGQSVLTRIVMDAAEHIRFRFTNYDPANSVHIMAWFVQKGKTA